MSILSVLSYARIDSYSTVKESATLHIVKETRAEELDVSLLLSLRASSCPGWLFDLPFLGWPLLDHRNDKFLYIKDLLLRQI